MRIRRRIASRSSCGSAQQCYHSKRRSVIEGSLEEVEVDFVVVGLVLQVALLLLVYLLRFRVKNVAGRSRKMTRLRRSRLQLTTLEAEMFGSVEIGNCCISQPELGSVPYFGQEEKEWGLLLIQHHGISSRRSCNYDNWVKILKQHVVVQKPPTILLPRGNVQNRRSSFVHRLLARLHGADASGTAEPSFSSPDDASHYNAHVCSERNSAGA